MRDGARAEERNRLREREREIRAEEGQRELYEVEQNVFIQNSSSRVIFNMITHNG